MKKVYLGDNAYAEITEQGVKLTTEELGSWFRATNIIELNSSMITKLVKFIKFTNAFNSNSDSPAERCNLDPIN